MFFTTVSLQSKWKAQRSGNYLSFLFYYLWGNILQTNVLSKMFTSKNVSNKNIRTKFGKKFERKFGRKFSDAQSRTLVNAKPISF